MDQTSSYMVKPTNISLCAYAFIRKGRFEDSREDLLLFSMISLSLTLA
jgi:hypothetical protein